MQSKAILFGINYNRMPEGEGRLRGCVNDVRAMARFLSEKAGFEVIKVYTDEDTPAQVGAQAIFHKLLRLAIDSYRYNLEKVWIHFSGHGGSIHDRGGDEYDGKDECLLPEDFDRTGVITDDLIKKILQRFNPSTRVTCVFDCCHSGTICDLAYEYRGRELVRSNTAASKCRADVVLLSGCMDSQTSADAYNVRGHYLFSGAMTSCLLDALDDSSSTHTVLETVTEALRRKGFSQIPRLSSSRPVDGSRVLY
jgi:hypothetical protein